VQERFGDRAGLVEFLDRLNYKTEDADEAAVLSSLADGGGKGLRVKAVRRVARHQTMGRDVRVWAVEVDGLKKVADANGIIQRTRRFRDRYDYLLIVTDYQNLLWVCPQGQVTYKLWLSRDRVYHSDLLTLKLLGLPDREAKWVTILQTWAEAFNTERVTNDFYRDYVKAQKTLAGAISGLPKGHDDELSRLDYAQLIMGRLMFLYFLQKKGWLGLEGEAKASGGRLNPDYDYLQRKYGEYVGRKGKSFYANFLRRLFFEVLCVERRQRKAAITREFGEIPFLNGGLFHKCEVEREAERKRKAIAIPDEAFEPILADDIETGLFRHYNFTVREDEPLEREVAVDPEMLGKVFEQQVVGREVKGAFYTPQPVVDYMCRESLKAFLLTRAAGEGDTAVEGGGKPVARETILDLVEMTPEEEGRKDVSRVSKLSNKEAIRLDTLLDGIAVIDPAVGSGAFLVGMLHRLVDLRCALIRRSIPVTRERAKFLNSVHTGRHRVTLKETAPSDPDLRYVLKRRIIQQNLHGVDIERSAIQIAQLRLWLSLAVEHEVEFVDHIQPLPNLDLNLVEGNSLIGTFRPKGSKEAFDLELELREPKPGSRTAQIIDDIERHHETYANAEEEDEKESCLKEVHDLHRQLLEEQVAQAIRKVKEDIADLKSGRLGDFYSHREERQLAHLEHQLEVLPRALKALKKDQSMDGSALPMLWTLRFPRVFAEKGGFDVCMANPPYVSTQGASKLPYTKDLVDKLGGKSWNDDHYVFFTYRALGHPEAPERMRSVTRPGGVACFITSDTYFTLGSKERVRSLLQSRRLLKIGQVDPFHATVDAAVYLVQNRGRIDGEPCEFFNGRFLGRFECDRLIEMSDRPAPDGERWVSEGEFVLPSAGKGKTKAAERKVESLRDRTLGKTEDGKRKDVWRYRADPAVWREALKGAIFEPFARNAALYNRFMGPLVALVGKWWRRIETSRKFEQNRRETETYHRTLKPGDVTLVGLVCEGGQGMRTANNGRFLAYSEGTAQADAILKRRDDLRDLWASSSATAEAYKKLSRKHEDFADLADAMKTQFQDWTGDLGLGRGEIYRVVPARDVVDVETMSDEDKKQGVGNVRKCWVPFRKGDPEGNKWVSFDPLYIFWSRENVEWLVNNSGRPEPNMPVMRNPHLYFTEGITWTAVGNHVCIKARIQPKCVFDADSMRLAPVPGTLSAKAFLALLNSDLLSYVKWRFLKNTQKNEIGDLRLFPIIMPSKEQEARLEALAIRGIEVQTDILQNGNTSRQAELDEIQAQVNAAVEELYGVVGLGPFDEF
jgi:hypothetical protein